MRRHTRWLLLATVFLYLVALSNDRLPLWVMACTLASIMLVCFGLARVGANGLQVRRRALPERLVAGQPLTLAFELRNVGSLPRSGLLLTDTWRNEVQRSHGEQTLLAPQLAGGASLHVESATAPAQRGVLSIGPVVVNVGDPFGLYDMVRPVAGTESTVIVHPSLETLTPRLAGGGWGTEEAAGGTAPSGLVMQSLRDYQAGDDLRHVHWLASARRGRLVTKEFERATSANAVVWLDLEDRPGFGSGPHSSLELGIVAAGSLLSWLGEMGRPGRLLAYEERLHDLSCPATGINQAVLDALAGFAGRGTVSLPALLAQQASVAAPGSTSILVTGGIDQVLVSTLLRLAEAGRKLWLVAALAESFTELMPEPPPPWALSEAALRGKLAGGGIHLSLLQPNVPVAVALSAGGEQL